MSFSDPLLGVSDVNACASFAHRLRQHVHEPRELVAAMRTVAERMRRERPHAAARLAALIDEYEACAVTPSLDAATGLEALAHALRHPEQAPAEVGAG